VLLVGALPASVLASVPATASAHGGTSGASDFLTDYGPLLAIAAVVLLGAGLAAWVLLARPDATPGGDESEGGAAAPPGAEP
jgi:hypothetical protein